MPPQAAPDGVSKVIAELDVLIRSRFPIIAIQTQEERRALAMIAQACNLEEARGRQPRPLYLWDEAEGLRMVTPNRFDESKELLEEQKLDEEYTDIGDLFAYIDQQVTGCFVLCDVGAVLAPFGQEQSALVRRLRNLAGRIKLRAVNLVCVGPNFPELPTLADNTHRFRLPLPDESEMRRLLETELNAFSNKYPDAVVDRGTQTMDRLAMALLGLSADQARLTIKKAQVLHRGLPVDAVRTILDQKKNLIAASDGLEYLDPESADAIGGYENIREILRKAAGTFTPEAREDFVEPSKGLLLVGLPGTGKDLTMRVAAGIFGRPCIRLNMSSIMGSGGGIIGQAELAIQRALSIAEAVNGVLGISEFEKAMAGMASSGRTDGGTTARALGTILNWMQEQSRCYVIATANDVRDLPPEMLRQGRFEDVVFVDLPDGMDRARIFEVHLRKRGQDPARFDLALLSSKAKGFSGAEIEGAVKGGLLEAHLDGRRPMRDQDVVDRMACITPTSELAADKVEELQAWARKNLARRGPGSKEGGPRQRVETVEL
jgi:ATP-dependent 26S proteasome regulatory subunit